MTKGDRAWPTESLAAYDARLMLRQDAREGVDYTI